MNIERAETPALALAFQSASLRKIRPEFKLVSELNADEPWAAGKATSRGQLARTTFFGSADIISATLGRIHPYLPKGQIHPSTRAGLLSLIRHLEFGQPKAVPRIIAHTLEGSAGVFGGPVANLHARLVLGCGGLSPLFGAHLPVSFHCPVPDSQANKSKVEPWCVVAEGRSSRAECLVITSLPMGDNDADRLTIFSGLHGAGTRAIDFVLQKEKMLERLYRATKHFIAWQTVIEVIAKDAHTPQSIGDFGAYEIVGIDFDDERNRVRSHFPMGVHRIEELMAMRPSEEVDLRDPSNTGEIIDLDLWKKRNYGRAIKHSPQRRMQSSPISDEHHLAGPRRLIVPYARPRGVHERRPLPDEASMNHTEITAANSQKTTKRRPGRPSKEKSEATLTRRFGLLLTEEDVERLETLMRHYGLGSMGQAIRDIIRKEHENILAKRRDRSKK